MHSDIPPGKYLMPVHGNVGADVADNVRLTRFDAMWES